MILDLLGPDRTAGDPLAVSAPLTPAGIPAEKTSPADVATWRKCLRFAFFIAPSVSLP